MNYIVLDMEWNQPLSKIKKEVGGIHLKGEVIQLGAVKLDPSFEILDTFKTNIKPVYYTKLNKHVKTITGLTSKELRGKPKFREAFCAFMEFCGDSFEIITWGCDDIPMLRDNMEANGLEPEVLPRCYNLQVVFNSQVSHETRQWSLEGAMERLGIPQELEAHDALDDAVNTAKIAQKLDMDKGIGEYSCSDSGLACSTVMILKASGFKTVSSAFNAPDMLTAECPFCKIPLEGEWLVKRNKRFKVAKCGEHGTFKFMTVVYHKGDCYCVKKKVSFASEDMVKSYREKTTV